MDHGKIAGSTRRGFTLVEILVAMVVLVLMVALLAKVLSFAQVGLGNLGASALRRQDAGTVLTNMAKDLRASLYPLNRSYEGADPATRQFQLLINPAAVPAGSGLRNGQGIFWSTSVPSTVGGAGLVGYFVRWGSTPGGTPQPLLCRMFLNTDQGLPQLTQIQAIVTPDAPEWVTTALANSTAPANLNNGYQGWLADNIIALYVRALDPYMNPIENYAQTVASISDGPYYAQNFTVNMGSTTGGSCVNQATTAQYDSRLGYQYTRSSDNTVINHYGPALPAAIELVIVAAEPREIGRLTAALTYPAPSGDPAQMWTEVTTFVTSLPAPLQKTARVYSTIVSP